MTSRNLAIVWAPNLIRPPRRATDWSECGQHAVIVEVRRSLADLENIVKCVLQSLILHYHAVFSPDSLAPVTEVSIDQAIARVARTSPSLEPETVTSLDPATSSLSLVAAAAPGRLARRCRSEAANLERLGSSLLRLNIKDEPSSSEAEAEDAGGELRPAQRRALCARHKKMLAAKHPRPRQNKGDTMNKILRALGRVVSFRHGHYTVNDARVRPRRAHETAHISNSSSENMLSNDGAPPGHNYFQGKQSVQVERTSRPLGAWLLIFNISAPFMEFDSK